MDDLLLLKGLTSILALGVGSFYLFHAFREMSRGKSSYDWGLSCYVGSVSACIGVLTSLMLYTDLQRIA